MEDGDTMKSPRFGDEYEKKKKKNAKPARCWSSTSFSEVREKDKNMPKMGMIEERMNSEKVAESSSSFNKE